jgi:hypothetical protein
MNKRDICEEIGEYYGEFYESMGGFLNIDDGEQSYSYTSEDELLKDWLPRLQETDSTDDPGYWTDVIEYILDLDN